MPILNDIAGVQDRNDLIHSIIGGNFRRLFFNRRITAERFTSKIEDYDKKRLNDAAKKCVELASALMDALSISKDDYKRFFQDAHNAANKL